MSRAGAKGSKKCGEKGCECTNYEPDAFRKDKCRNCFHVHPPTDTVPVGSPKAGISAVLSKPPAPLLKAGSDRLLVDKAAIERADRMVKAAAAATAEKTAAAAAVERTAKLPVDRVENVEPEQEKRTAEEIAPIAVDDRELTPTDADEEPVSPHSAKSQTDPRSFPRKAPPPSRKAAVSPLQPASLPVRPPLPALPKRLISSSSPLGSTSAASPTATPPLPVAPPASAVSRPVSFETSCDHATAISLEESFCLACGTRIAVPATADIELVCICGNRNEDSDKFCTRCGEQATTTRGKLFEGFIDAHIRFSPYAVPKISFDCTEYLKQYALSVEGVFRVSGNNEAVQAGRADFEQEYKLGKDSTESPIASCDDPHTVAGILKLYYRKLRVPVIPFSAYDHWISLADKTMSPAARLRKMQILVSELPATHRIVLAYHLDLLRQLSAHIAETKMGPRSLAVVFGPGLLRRPDMETPDSMLAKEMAGSVDALEMLLLAYDDVFPEGCPDIQGAKPVILPQPLVVRERVRPGGTPRDPPHVAQLSVPEKALEKQREELEAFAARAEQNFFKIQAMPQKEGLDIQFNEFMETKKFVAHSLAPVSDKLPDNDKWQILCLTNEAELAICEGKAGPMKDPLALVEGWLLLIVNHSSKHSNYFCVLRPGVLRYYTDKGDKKPAGEIVFTKSTSRYQNSNSTSKSPNPQFPYPFVLDTHPDNPSSGKYTLYSESKESREGWMVFLELAILADPEKNKPLSANSVAYDLTLGMMIGIRTSVGRTGGMVLNAIAAEKDFQEVVSYNFPSKGSKETPPHKLRDFGFKDYCPHIFRRIRQHFGIDPSSYLLGVCGNSDYLNFVSNSRSGEFFFYSHDRKYMIKTISKNECKFLFVNMSSYYRHLMNNNPNCFINKFFGLHKVSPADQSEKWFLVMGSVFPSHLKMHRLFDLKGSTHNRQVKPSDRGKDGTVYKDNDFLQQGAALVVGPEIKAKLERQLKRDVEWLESLRIIDYSVLLGMHYRQGFYASSTNVQVFVSDSFFGDNLGQTLALEFKLEDTVGDVIKQCVKMMRSLPKMQLNNPAQDFCFVRSDGREVLDEKALMARQTPLSLMEIVLKEALPKTSLPSPHRPLIPPSPSNSKVSQAVNSWRSALSELCPALAFSLKATTEAELLALSPAEFVAKAKGNPIAGCLFAELKHMVEVASVEQGSVPSSFTETEGGLAAKDEMGNDVILYIGIIDTLIEYNLKKKMEHQYKHKVQGLAETAFSVVEPNMYAQRLLGFITDKIR